MHLWKRSIENSVYLKSAFRLSLEQSQFPSYIHIDIKWKQDAITIIGGNGKGRNSNQLSFPWSIYIDDNNQDIYVVDKWNHCIVEYMYDEKHGQVIAGGNGQGNQRYQLNSPTDVIVDKKNDSLIICDRLNRRIVRWSRQNGMYGQTIISNIDCWGLTMDNNGNLYVSDYKRHEIRRWKIGDKNGTVVAGGNGKGDHLNQLNQPTFICVDQDHSVYISDHYNHRIIKWMKDAKEGIVVAGGQGKGNSLAQLSYPYGIFVDHLGHVYVVDYGNDRIMRWSKGSTEGSIIVGGNGKGEESNQFNDPVGLSFDRQGNLYVVDNGNNRIQKFEIDSK